MKEKSTGLSFTKDYTITESKDQNRNLSFSLSTTHDIGVYRSMCMKLFAKNNKKQLIARLFLK